MGGIGVKGSDGVLRNGIRLENVGGEMYMLVEEFEEESMEAASSKRREIKLELKRGDEQWMKSGGKFNGKKLNRFEGMTVWAEGSHASEQYYSIQDGGVQGRYRV